MERLTVFESILKIFNAIFSIPYLIEILILTILMLIIMIFFYFRKNKTGKKVTVLIYVISTILLPITHVSFFIQTIDKIIENYVSIIYFPSCYIYIAMIIIVDVGIIKTLFKNIKDDQQKWYYLIDIIYFFLFQYLTFAIVRIVIINNIDIFEKVSLYSNSTLTSFIQINSFLFWIRIGIKLFIYLVNNFSGINTSKPKSKIKRVNSQVQGQPQINILPNEQKYIPKNNDLLADSFKKIENNKIINKNEKKQENSQNNSIFTNTSSSFNNNIKTTQTNEKLKELPPINLNLNDDEEDKKYFDDFYE